VTPIVFARLVQTILKKQRQKKSKEKGNLYFLNLFFQTILLNQTVVISVILNLLFWKLTKVFA